MSLDKKTDTRSGSVAVTLLNLGELEYRSGNFDQAKEYLEEAIKVDEPSKNGRGHAAMAMMYLSQNQPNDAITHLKSAIARAETLREAARRFGERLFSRHQRHYQHLIRALISRDAAGDAALAFEYAERIEDKKHGGSHSDANHGQCLKN